MPQDHHATEQLRKLVQRAGFSAVGICPAAPPQRLTDFLEWLESGYAGEMHYLQERQEAYRHPNAVLEGVRSIVMMTLPYRTEQPQETAPGTGRVSHYAWGPSDYHDVIHTRFKRLLPELSDALGGQWRGVVDTAPLMERDHAQLAGLGWIGKHTLLLNKSEGSLFFLAALLTNLELPYDQPFATDHCGTCTACLDVCPTDAFPQPYVLDATRCISYLTIELRAPIPRSLRSAMGAWVFGCDLCQDVCPWNRKVPATEEPEFQPLNENNPLDLIELFDLDDEGFRQRFRRTPLWRSKRRGLLRNAAIALGNHPTPAAFGVLSRGLNDDESLVRGACAWALAHYDPPAACRVLQERLAIEQDLQVREEISWSLRQLK